MNNIGSNNQILDNYLFWFFIYLGIGFIISFILPFPISLVAMLLAVLLINILRKEIALRKSGIGGIKELYKSLSSASNSGIGRFGVFAYNQTKFYCMSCGYEHKKIACPKCGSKMVRAG
jgi:hypothetical protein